MKVSEIVPGSVFRGLFKGEFGTGKTRAYASFPKPMYVFDLDNKMETVKKDFPKEATDEIEFDSYNPSAPTDMVRLWNRLKKEIEIPRFRTYVFDSVTTLSLGLLTYAIDLRGNDVKQVKGIIRMTELADFNVESQGFNQIVTAFRSIAAHLIMTAHVIQTTQKDIMNKDESKRTVVTRELIAGTKKNAAIIPGLFKEVWHFYSVPNPAVGQPPIRKIITAAMGDDFATTGLPLPVEIEWTNKNLYDVIREELKKKGVDL